MIDEKTLRIGNWLTDEDGTLFQVGGIEFYGFYQILSLSGLHHSLQNSNPIPLTREILEKCGLEKIGGGYWSEKGFLLLTEYHGYYGFKYNLLQSMPVKISTLHQLQNLYYTLCGEELNVQL